MFRWIERSRSGRTILNRFPLFPFPPFPSRAGGGSVFGWWGFPSCVCSFGRFTWLLVVSPCLLPRLRSVSFRSGSAVAVPRAPTLSVSPPSCPGCLSPVCGALWRSVGLVLGLRVFSGFPGLFPLLVGWSRSRRLSPFLVALCCCRLLGFPSFLYICIIASIPTTVKRFFKKVCRFFC